MRYRYFKKDLNSPLQIAMALGVGLVFLLPFERIPSVDVYGVTIRLSQLAALAMIFFAAPYVNKIKKNLLKPQYYLLGLFMASYFMSALFALNKTASVKIFTFTIFVASAAVVLSLLSGSEKQFKSYEKALALTSIIVLTIGMYQYLGDVFGLDYHFTGLREAYTKAVFGFPRIQSTALEPLFLASFLLIPLFVFSAQYVTDNKKLISSNSVLISALACEVFLTVSRGAVIGLVFGTAYLALITVRRSWKGLLKHLLLIGVSILLALGLTAIQNPFNHRIDVSERSANKQQRLIKQTTNLDSQSDRTRNRKLAIDAFKTHPILGIGPGNFDSYAKSKFPEYLTIGNSAIVVNNLSLEMLAESGIVGSLWLVLFIGYVFIKSVRIAIAMDGPFSIWALGLTSYMVATAIQYQTFSTFYIMHIWVVLGLLMGIILYQQSTMKRVKGDSASKKAS